MRPVCELAGKKAVHRAVARAGQIAGFSLRHGTLSPRFGAHLVHAEVAAQTRQREKVRPVRPERSFGAQAGALVPLHCQAPVSERRLSLTTQGKIRYQLKTPYRDGTRNPTHAAPWSDFLSLMEPFEFWFNIVTP